MPTQNPERIPELKFEDVLARMQSRKASGGPRESFLAMFSTWWGGIVREPEAMLVPIDDHMVHRGDGVFEAMKCVEGGIYAMDRHLRRLEKSAALIGLVLPKSRDEIAAICVQTVRAAEVRDCLIRLYVSRGPGGFSPNPYESIGAQLYVVVTRMMALPVAHYMTGVSCRVSQVPIKPGFFATVKSCNYLPNVLMKKEAVDHGVAFSVGLDEKGFVAEGATENFAIVSREGELILPGFERTLEGITAIRAMELARAHLAEGDAALLKDVRCGGVRVEDVYAAREVFFLGTTIDCLPVVEFNGQKINGAGKPGPVARTLYALFQEDLRTGPLVTRLP